MARSRLPDRRSGRMKWKTASIFRWTLVLKSYMKCKPVLSFMCTSVSNSQFISKLASTYTWTPVSPSGFIWNPASTFKLVPICKCSTMWKLVSCFHSYTGSQMHCEVKAAVWWLYGPRFAISWPFGNMCKVFRELQSPNYKKSVYRHPQNTVRRLMNIF